MAIEARRVIRATPDRIFAHIGRVEHLPRYAAPLWMTVEAAERQRVAHVVTLAGYLIGLPIESVQRVVLHPPTSLEFKQIRGTLRALSGRCTLESVEDGTEVRYRLEVDAGIPMVTDDAVRQFLVQVVERMLNRIKLAAERKAPVRRPGRAAVPASGALEGEEDEQVAPEPAAAASPSDALDDRQAAPSGPVSPGEPAIRAGAEPAPQPHPPGEPATGSPASGRSAEPHKPRGRRRRRRHRGRAAGGPSAAPPVSR